MSSGIFNVTAPLTGTFYEAPTPEEPPYVEVGQKVKAGDIVCIIESMKVFTELRTDMGGIIKRILVEDEETVMKNQKLIEMEVT